MNRTIFKIAYILFYIILFLSLLFSAVHIVAYNEAYYQRFYEKNNIMALTGMDKEGLMETTEVLLSYIKGERDNIDVKAEINGQIQEVFGEKEKLHMSDVKKITIAGEAIRIYGKMILAIFLIFCLYRKDESIAQLLSGVKYSFAIFASIMMGIGGLAVIDFNKYFVVFHKIFFNNDLWLLNPETDILINMVPENFFYSTAIWIIIVFLVLALLAVILAEAIKEAIKKNLSLSSENIEKK